MPYPLRLRLVVWVHGERNIKIKEMDCKKHFLFFFSFKDLRDEYLEGLLFNFIIVRRLVVGSICAHIYNWKLLSRQKHLFGDNIQNSIRGIFPCRHQILGKHLECKEFSHLYHSQTGSSPRKALHHQRRCLSQQLREG